MAAVTLTPVKLAKFNRFSGEITTSSMTEAGDATDGVFLEMNDEDGKTLILAQNTNASTTKRTLTVKAGNGLQGGEDLVCEIAAGKTVLVAIESGRFKNVSGTNKGKVKMTVDNAEVKLAAFILP